MALYYFDLRDAGYLSVDEDGMELPTMQSVQILDDRRDRPWPSDGNRSP